VAGLDADPVAGSQSRSERSDLCEWEDRGKRPGLPEPAVRTHVATRSQGEAITVGDTKDLTRSLRAIANLDHNAAVGVFSTRHRRWRRPVWRDPTSFSSPSVSPSSAKAPPRCMLRVQLRPRHGTRPDHPRRRHSGQKPAGRRTATRGGDRRPPAQQAGTRHASGMSFSICGHQQLADAAETSRPMAGTTMALLGHGRAQPSGGRLFSGAPARGLAPRTRICPFTGSLHEAVPGG
jgi:hypothetical protein